MRLTPLPGELRPLKLITQQYESDPNFVQLTEGESVRIPFPVRASQRTAHHARRWRSLQYEASATQQKFANGHRFFARSEFIPHTPAGQVWCAASSAASPRSEIYCPRRCANRTERPVLVNRHTPEYSTCWVYAFDSETGRQIYQPIERIIAPP